MISDGGVVLGERNRRFILGPDSFIHCAELDIQSDRVLVDAGRGDAGPSLLVASAISTPGNLAVELSKPNVLIVISSGSCPPLKPYMRLLAELPEYALSPAAYVGLRAILRAFRQRAGRSPSVYEELLDQRIVKEDGGRLKLLARLMELEIIRHEGGHYYLDTAALSRHGINWHSVTDGVPTSEVLKFLHVLASE